MSTDGDNAKPCGPPERPSIDERIEAELGERLRDAFSDVFEEPIPERFRQLIEALSKGSQR